MPLLLQGCTLTIGATHHFSSGCFSQGYFPRHSGRRTPTGHTTHRSQVSPGKITDVESLKLDGAVHRPLFGRPKLREMVLCGNGSPVAMISGAAYSTTSALLILLNK